MKADAAEAEEALDPFGPLLAALKVEMKTLAQQHVEARRNPLLSVKTYGKPFDQGNANRLMYWPSKRASMPLLFLVSQQH